MEDEKQTPKASRRGLNLKEWADKEPLETLKKTASPLSNFLFDPHVQKPNEIVAHEALVVDSPQKSKSMSEEPPRSQKPERYIRRSSMSATNNPPLERATLTLNTVAPEAIKSPNVIKTSEHGKTPPTAGVTPVTPMITPDTLNLPEIAIPNSVMPPLPFSPQYLPIFQSMLNREMDIKKLLSLMNVPSNIAAIQSPNLDKEALKSYFDLLINSRNLWTLLTCLVNHKHAFQGNAVNSTRSLYNAFMLCTLGLRTLLDNATDCRYLLAQYLTEPERKIFFAFSEMLIFIVIHLTVSPSSPENILEIYAESLSFLSTLLSLHIGFLKEHSLVSPMMPFIDIIK
jgi:hypothetical protein